MKIVKLTMVHGLCSTGFPNAPCMINKDQNNSSLPKYSKQYPRSFQTTTIVKEDGYPLYRYRDNGQT